jgi:5-methylcytosine-specific restriction endonuclease McrA
MVREIGGSRATVDHLLRAELWDLAEDGRGYWLAHGPNPIRPLWEIERTDYRRKIPADVRALVYARDGFVCVECGAAEGLSLDHIYPWSLGGSDHETNLRTLCRPCNSHKGARIDGVVR